MSRTPAQGEGERVLQDQLFKAIKTGESDTVRELIKKGADVNAENENQYTPLGLASMYGLTEVTRVLLAADAKPNLKDTLGMSPLHHAAKYNNKEIVEALIGAKADVNALNNQGKSPLYIAASNDRPFNIAALIKGNADITIGTKELEPFQKRSIEQEIGRQKRAVQPAQQQPPAAPVQQQPPAAPVQQQPPAAPVQQQSPVQRPPAVPIWVDQVPAAPVQQQSPVQRPPAVPIWVDQVPAAPAQQQSPVQRPPAVPIWVDQVPAAPAQQQPVQRPPLLADQLHQAITNNDEGRVNKLLADPNFNINITHQATGATLLHQAAHVGNKRIIRALINRGADSNAKDARGQTPLHWSTNAKGGMGTLLELGADPKVQDRLGNTPLHYARQVGNQQAMRVLEEALARAPAAVRPAAPVAPAQQQQAAQPAQQQPMHLQGVPFDLSARAPALPPAGAQPAPPPGGKFLGRVSPAAAAPPPPGVPFVVPAGAQPLQQQPPVQQQRQAPQPQPAHAVETPLHKSVLSGRGLYTEINKLKASGQTLNTLDANGNTALDLAKGRGNREAAAILLANGARFNQSAYDRNKKDYDDYKQRIQNDYVEIFKKAARKRSQSPRRVQLPPGQVEEGRGKPLSPSPSPRAASPGRGIG